MRHLLLTALAVLLLAGGPAAAAPEHQGLDAPKEQVILTVSGAITHTNGDGVARFDRPMLEALAGRLAMVETPWLEGMSAFEGPLASAVLEAVGASGSRLRIEALNDYVAYIPMEDIGMLDIILATRLNGRPMSVRDRGPIFIIYPFDQDASLYNEAVFSRSVWQVRGIVVE